MNILQPNRPVSWRGLGVHPVNVIVRKMGRNFSLLYQPFLVRGSGNVEKLIA
jgi:hypothetical protein